MLGTSVSLRKEDLKGKIVDRYYEAYEVPYGWENNTYKKPDKGKAHESENSFNGKSPTHTEKDSYKKKDFKKKKRIEKDDFDFQKFLRVWRARSTKNLVEAWKALSNSDIKAIKSHLSQYLNGGKKPKISPLKYLQTQAWETSKSIKNSKNKPSKYDIKC